MAREQIRIPPRPRQDDNCSRCVRQKRDGGKCIALSLQSGAEQSSVSCHVRRSACRLRRIHCQASSCRGSRIPVKSMPRTGCTVVRATVCDPMCEEQVTERLLCRRCNICSWLRRTVPPARRVRHWAGSDSRDITNHQEGLARRQADGQMGRRYGSIRRPRTEHLGAWEAKRIVHQVGVLREPQFG